MKYYAVKKTEEYQVFITLGQNVRSRFMALRMLLISPFTSRTEAEEFISDKKEIPQMEHGLIAYVDGSFNAKKKVYGYGLCIN